MNYLDIVIAIPLLWGAFIGFKNGLLLELGTIAALILGIWGAIEFSHFVGNYLNKHFSIDAAWTEIIAFALTFIGIVIGIYLLLKLIDNVLKKAALGTIIRISGAIVGIAKFGILLAFFLMILDFFNTRFNFLDPDLEQQSLLYRPLLETAYWIKDTFL